MATPNSLLVSLRRAHGGLAPLVALPLGRRKARREWGVLHWRARRLTLAEETFIGLCRSAADCLTPIPDTAEAA